jgi:hypothetical protein
MYKFLDPMVGPLIEAATPTRPLFERLGIDGTLRVIDPVLHDSQPDLDLFAHARSVEAPRTRKTTNRIQYVTSREELMVWRPLTRYPDGL